MLQRKQSAAKVQAMMRGKKARNAVEEKKANLAVGLEEDAEEEMRVLREEVLKLRSQVASAPPSTPPADNRLRV